MFLSASHHHHVGPPRAVHGNSLILWGRITVHVRKTRERWANRVSAGKDHGAGSPRYTIYPQVKTMMNARNGARQACERVLAIRSCAEQRDKGVESPANGRRVLQEATEDSNGGGGVRTFRSGKGSTQASDAHSFQSGPSSFKISEWDCSTSQLLGANYPLSLKITHQKQK